MKCHKMTDRPKYVMSVDVTNPSNTLDTAINMVIDHFKHVLHLINIFNFNLLCLYNKYLEKYFV